MQHKILQTFDLALYYLESIINFADLTNVYCNLVQELIDQHNLCSGHRSQIRNKKKPYEINGSRSSATAERKPINLQIINPVNMSFNFYLNINTYHNNKQTRRHVSLYLVAVQISHIAVIMYYSELMNINELCIYSTVNHDIHKDR